MLNSGPKIFMTALGLFTVFALSQIILEQCADARAGGGRSGGFRGSRSYQAPARPAQPTSPRREAAPTPQQPAPYTPAGGGFMRGLGTAILGGFLGSMLFSGIANAGFGGFGGSGFGLIEILLLAGLGYFLLQKFRRSAGATGYQPMQYQGTAEFPPRTASFEDAPSTSRGIDYRSLTMMDRTFDPDRFLKTAQDLFFKIQGAWNKQDTTTLSSLCGSELMQNWQEELNKQRALGRQNRMENIALRESEISEAWTENGADFITVRLHANLVDYTVDARTGNVVSGSNTEPVQFEEYWTFSRPVGPNGWKLTAVQQA